MMGPGSGMNSDMQEDLKKMTKTVFSTLLEGDGTEPPVKNSKIEFYEKISKIITVNLLNFV